MVIVLFVVSLCHKRVQSLIALRLILVMSKATFNSFIISATSKTKRVKIMHNPALKRDAPSARPVYLSLREWPRLPFTARIERAQFHRARSASKKGTWPLPPSPLFREQEDIQAAL